MSEIENLKIGNGGTLHIVGNEDIIANEWEAGQVYIENRSYVIREHKLLMCNTTHTSVEPFDPDKWTEKNIGEALGTAGSANMIECTLAEYTTWKAGGQLINETVYVITDAPNLNATAQDISYDGGADTVWDKVEEIGTELTAAWTASTTSAYGTNLTDSITVTKGTWVIAWGHPNQSGDIGCFISGIATNSDISDQFITFDGGKELTKNTIIAKFTGNATLRVASGGSASVTFSNTTRGFLRAVKVSA